MNQSLKESPTFKGLNWYRKQYFSLFLSDDWQRFDWPDGREGVVFLPSGEDTETIFGVEVADLGLEILAEDKEDLKAGFLNSIQELPESNVEEHKDWVVGNKICLEAKYTYLEDASSEVPTSKVPTQRKRWVRVLYDKSRQISFIAQGSSPEAFEFWLPMFYQAMMTSSVHDEKPSIEAQEMPV